MKQASLLKHLRDILILPFTVTVIVPYCIYSRAQQFLPELVAVKITGLLIFLVGIWLFLVSVLLFVNEGKGTLAPWEPTQKLIIKGPYEYCRNPMITGVLFILIGEVLLFHSMDIAIWAALFFCINTAYFIFKEEPDMEKRFGEEYRQYKTKVPRWIPNLKAYKPIDAG